MEYGMPFYPRTQVTAFHEEITSVATSAVQEGVLEEMMEKVSAMWAKTEFEVSTWHVGPCWLCACVLQMLSSDAHWIPVCNVAHQKK